MASLNRVQIIGNLGQDPELRHTGSNTAVCTLNIATTDSRTDREGQKKETTEWHRVIVWSKQAENCARYLTKGKQVYVEGRLQTRSWEDKQTGQKRFTTEIVASNVQFLGAPGGGNHSPAQRQERSSARHPQQESYTDFAGGEESAEQYEEVPF